MLQSDNLKPFDRKLIRILENWKNSPVRKPLVLRGARQTGKTTAVNIFAGQFLQYIYINFEEYEDRKIFERERSFSLLIDDLFFSRRINKSEETLLFLDEIQHSPNAVSLLRYFYEKTPQYHVIAAGSMLEHAIDMKTAFPVGRVNYAYIYPVTFEEFLTASGDSMLLEAYSTIPALDKSHNALFEKFNLYTIIGGMPEAVKIYLDTGDLNQVVQVYSNLVKSWADDIEKYTNKGTGRDAVRHVFHTMMHHPAERITYNGYGSSRYGSQIIKEAFQTLGRAMLCSLIHPLTSLTMPVVPNLRKKPRLHLLDTGLCCHAMGIQQDMLRMEDLSSTAKGKIVEHITGQELSVNNICDAEKLDFWVRDKNQSSAEIDYIFRYGTRLVPIEVKSGKSGKLRSLKQFMEFSPEKTALRFYGGIYSEETMTAAGGKLFTLVNIPYYHAAKAAEYIEKHS